MPLRLPSFSIEFVRLGRVIQLPRIPALLTDRLRTVLVRLATEFEGAEHATARCELRVLRVVGLAIFGTHCSLHGGGFFGGVAH